MYYPNGGRRLVVWDGDQKASIKRDAQLVRVQIAPKNDALAIDGWKDEVELWDASIGKLVRSFPCEGGSGCFAFSPDGALIAIGEIGHGGGLYPRHVYVYETATGRKFHKLTGHEWQVNTVAFSPDGRQLASLSDDLILWDLGNTRKHLLRKALERTTGGLAFAGRELVAVERGRVRVFSGARERIAFDAPIDFQTPWVVSDDGRHLCVAGTQSVFRFRLDTGELDDHIAAPIPGQNKCRQMLSQWNTVRAGAMLWRTEYGPFLHQSDGPRGWIPPVRPSQGHVVLPAPRGRGHECRRGRNGATRLRTLRRQAECRARC